MFTELRSGGCVIFIEYIYNIYVIDALVCPNICGLRIFDQLIYK